MIKNTNTYEEIDEILERMLERHRELSRKYFLNSSDFRTETPDEYVRNRSEEVTFKIKSEKYDCKIKIKQTCWINEADCKLYFKTKYYINDKLTKKNVKFLEELADLSCFTDVEIEYPIKEEANTKVKKDEQMSLFDFIN